MLLLPLAVVAVEAGRTSSGLITPWWLSLVTKRGGTGEAVAAALLMGDRQRRSSKAPAPAGFPGLTMGMKRLCLEPGSDRGLVRLLLLPPGDWLGCIVG